MKALYKAPIPPFSHQKAKAQLRQTETGPPVRGAPPGSTGRPERSCKGSKLRLPKPREETFGRSEESSWYAALECVWVPGGWRPEPCRMVHFGDPFLG